MVVNLSGELRVVADGLCYELQRKGTKGARSKTAGAEVWKSIGYYPSLEQACVSALLKGLCTGEEERTATEIITAIRETANMIAKACAAVQTQPKKVANGAA